MLNRIVPMIIGLFLISTSAHAFVLDESKMALTKGSGNGSYSHEDFDVLLKGMVLKRESIVSYVSQMEPRLGTRIRPADSLGKGYDINYVLYSVINEHFEIFIAANKQYIADMGGMDPTKLTKTNQLAYWLNLRNAMVMDLIFENLPMKTKELKTLIMGEAWDTPRATVMKQALSIRDIEEMVTSTWADPRVIYGFYYGTHNSPFLMNEAFNGENVLELLEANARDYLNASATLKISRSGKLELPPVFEWHQATYKADTGSLVSHLSNYVEGKQLSKLQRNTPTTLAFKYNWKVNDVPTQIVGTGENKLFVFGAGIGCTGIQTPEGCDAGVIPEAHAFHAHLITLQRQRARGFGNQ